MICPKQNICPLLFCDVVNRDCLLTPREAAKLVVVKPITEKWEHGERMLEARRAKMKPFVPDTSMAVRYDKRRKKDTPRRQWERAYRARKRTTASHGREAQERAAR